MVHRVPYSELLAANNLDSFWIVKLNIKEHEILHTVTRRPEVTDPRLNFQEHYPKTKINKMIFLPKNGSSLLSLFTFSSVQFSSVAQLCPTLCDPMNCSTPGSLSITNSQSSLRLMSRKSVMPSSHLILCRPLLLLPPNPSQHEVAKVLEFQL